MYGYEDHLDGLRQEMDGAERAMASMERQLDRAEQENHELRQRLNEAEIEIQRLQAGIFGRVSLDADWTGESLAQQFHETYERLAPGFGYRTREASAKPWAEVPEQNRALMIAVATEILEM